MTAATLNVRGAWGQPLTLKCYWLHAPFSVTRDAVADGYRVTHLPTGYALLGDFDSRAHAIRFARMLRRSFRWETVTREGWDSLSSEERQAMGVAICAAKWATSREGRAS